MVSSPGARRTNSVVVPSLGIGEVAYLAPDNVLQPLLCSNNLHFKWSIRQFCEVRMCAAVTADFPAQVMQITKLRIGEEFHSSLGWIRADMLDISECKEDWLDIHRLH